MIDTTSAPSVLTNERLAILAVNPTEANNALGKEVRAMALELQRRRASDSVRAELLEAAQEYAAATSYFFAINDKGQDTEELRDAMFVRDRARDRLCRAAITRAEAAT